VRIEIRGRTFDVRSDGLCWHIGEVKKRQTGKNAGDEYIDDASRAYVRTVANVASHLLDYNLLKSDADSLAELVQIASELRREIRALFEGKAHEAPQLAVAGGGRR